MAIRLLPFRDYSEHDVVNIYRMDGAKGDFIDLSDAAKRSTDKGDAGVFVKVQNGTLNSAVGDWDPVDVDSNLSNLLGKTDYPHVGRNNYPQASLTVTPVTASGDACIGLTLRQTVERDENGENLLYNPLKKEELYGVLPGEAVPVLSRGMIAITDLAVAGTASVGDSLVTHQGGRVSGVAHGAHDAGDSVGTVLAKGHRDDVAVVQGTGAASQIVGSNVFGDKAYQSGDYYIVKLNCA